MEQSIELEVTSNPTDEDVRVLSQGLERFNQASAFGANRNKNPIAVWLRQDGEVLGGANGDTHYGWLYIGSLWVAESLRGQGWGRRLMAHLESEAVANGCQGAWVDTYGFQAPGFYERIGYVEFGRLDEFPPGSARHFFQKSLDPGR
jgi:ribosomal protein S18 acetylase RimI-like enzyme